MRGGNRDVNHAEVRDALRKVAPATRDTGDLGGGFPDLMVPWRGKLWWVEVKKPGPPSARKLSPAETKMLAWCRRVGQPYIVVQSAEEFFKKTLLDERAPLPPHVLIDAIQDPHPESINGRLLASKPVIGRAAKSVKVQPCLFDNGLPEAGMREVFLVMGMSCPCPKCSPRC